MVELTSLWLPILLSAMACFFLGFMTWMVLPVHKADWGELPDEDAFGEAVRSLGVQPGNYMFPYCENAEQMKSEAFIAKQQRGPVGVVQVWEETGAMGKQLACQFLYYVVVGFCIAYLATLSNLAAGADFMAVFRFVGTAGILIYAAANVPSAIWFRSRIMGHIVDGILFGLATAAIFAALWPAAVAS